MHLRRREVLAGSAGVFITALLNSPAAFAAKGSGTAFSFDALTKQAKAIAAKDFEPPAEIQNSWLRDLGYDGYRDVRYTPAKAWWSNLSRPFRMEFFHLGSIYRLPISIHEVQDGVSRPIAYDPKLFNFGKLTPPPEALAEPKGYAGLRVHYPLNNPNVWDELFVFLGASYFRGLGRNQVYGLSARGLAVDTAMAKGEEFPLFKAFWMERPRRGVNQLRLWALLDSPSVAGAYEFVITPGRDVVMDVKARLFARGDVGKLGVAPLTSMFEFGENDDRISGDFRPEVHDSDGFLMRHGEEWLWRPLRNPRNLSVSSFSVTKPLGFGLLQRDRSFDHYQDLEGSYERRPSLWVEPQGDWGKGVIEVVEIPTDSEIHDNIVAYWVPEAKVKAGDALNFGYRLTWGTAPQGVKQPWPVSSTHIGKQFSDGHIKFVVDFEGGFSESEKLKPQVELWVGAGIARNVVAVADARVKGWRVSFDFEPQGAEAAEMRCFLRVKGKQASETWSYLWNAN